MLSIFTVPLAQHDLRWESTSTYFVAKGLSDLCLSQLRVPLRFLQALLNNLLFRTLREEVFGLSQERNGGRYETEGILYCFERAHFHTFYPTSGQVASRARAGSNFSLL